MVATRKIYVAVADILNGLYEDGVLISPTTAERFADVFAEDNPRFDYSKFMAAIHPYPEN
tara:strand:+ start:172 stop:351 length:180 start_codon:yes stop_codon:yes gene_type:complete